jgi:hypothetical protein
VTERRPGSGTISGRHLVAQLPEDGGRHRSDPVGRGGPFTGSDHRLKPGGGEATKHHLSPTERGKGMGPVKNSTSSPYASDAPSPEAIYVRGSLGSPIGLRARVELRQRGTNMVFGVPWWVGLPVS